MIGAPFKYVWRPYGTLVCQILSVASSSLEVQSRRVGTHKIVVDTVFEKSKHYKSLLDTAALSHEHETSVIAGEDEAPDVDAYVLAFVAGFWNPGAVVASSSRGWRSVQLWMDDTNIEVQFPTDTVRSGPWRDKKRRFKLLLDLTPQNDTIQLPVPVVGYNAIRLAAPISNERITTNDGRHFTAMVSIGAGSKILEMEIANCLRLHHGLELGDIGGAYLIDDDSGYVMSTMAGKYLDHIHVLADYTACVIDDTKAYGIAHFAPKCSSMGSRNTTRGQCDLGTAGNEIDAPAVRDSNATMRWMAGEVGKVIFSDERAPLSIESTKNLLPKFESVERLLRDFFVKNSTSGCVYDQRVGGLLVRHEYVFWLKNIDWKPRPVCQATRDSESSWCSAVKLHMAQIDANVTQPAPAHHRIGGSLAGIGSVYAATTPYPEELCKDAASHYAHAIANRYRKMYEYTIQY